MTPPESPWFPRFGAIESSSSKKMTHGLASRARWNTRRTFASDSPMYMLSSSGPLTEKKLSEHVVATALASSVLPVPGGPYRSTPLRFFTPSLNSSGCSSGSCTVSRISSLTAARPPTSSHDTLGILGAPMLSA